ncbi:MAG: SpoIIE family protein phosphatase [Armatimonadetes bacterium]|nr:SpoIIE family protein phosphatase [Armatimonadota bacterium]
MIDRATDSSRPALTPGVRVITLAVILAVILIGVGIGLAWQEYESERDRVVDRIGFRARIAATDVGRLLEDLIDLAEAIAAAPAVQDLERPAMRDYFNAVLKVDRSIDGILWADAQGNVRVRSRLDPPDPPPSIAHRDYFRTAVVSRKPAISRALIRPIDGKPVVTLAVPTVNRASALSGVLVAAIPLTGLQGLVAEFRTPQLGRLSLVDGADQVIAGSPLPPLRDVSRTPLLREARERGAGVLIDVADLYGNPHRVVAFARVKAGGWTVFVDSPMGEAFGPARHAFLLTVFLVLLGGLIAIGGGTWTGRHLDRVYRAQQEARERAERTVARIARLQAVTAALSQALTPPQVARVIINEGVAALDARAGAVQQLVADGTALELLEAVGFPARLIQQRRHVRLGEKSPSADVVRAKQPVLLESTEAFLARYPNLREFVPSLAGGAFAFIPLSVETRIVGVLTLHFAEPRTFAGEDLDVILTLGNQCAQALERARLYAHEHEIAETLQRSLLPQALPEIPGIEIVTRYLSSPLAEVGGDWYDVFTLPGGHVGFVIGDVAGRGVRAAAVMGQLRHMLRAHALEGQGPAAVLQRLNRLMDPGEMATVCYFTLDPMTWEARYANAGHCPPLVVAPDDAAQFLWRGSPPLGNLRYTYSEEAVVLAPGSTVVLYTDGLIEIQESIDEGLARLERTVTAGAAAEMNALLDRILEEVLRGERARDDIALLAFRLSPLDATRIHVRVPAAPASIANIRHILLRWLTQAGVDAREAHGITVACAEACTNVVEHAYGVADGDLEVAARRTDDGVEVVVRDWGQWRPPRGEGRGRGLDIIRGLIDGVEITSDSGGTLVRMERRLRHEGGA